ncbi:glycoside hydrolase family 105 protein [Pedobacter nutrimenti]|uniref:glycoside hydrolase family 88/105 protein n=1 Tax=Pedobacter nutrimenti TaxID=1241337 RepID=UPI002930A5B7|nr:glycoside hydrolase family 88 protein [Pedobacter nutrimenti]
MFKLQYTIILTFIFCGMAYVARAQKDFFRDMPEHSDPRKVGMVLTNHYLESQFSNFGLSTPPGAITYSEVCTWYGALKFTGVAKETKLSQLLDLRFRPLLYEKKNLQPRPDHVDPSIFGSIPLELYMQFKNPVYMDMGRWFADQQWTMPQNPKQTYQNLLDSGLSWQTRMWIDDMYMITNLQAQAYRSTGDVKYINRAAHEMVVYLRQLQRPNGLFYHAPDVPFFWGRGNGWMAAGMTELLKSLPENNPDYRTILLAYQKMMNSLKKYQTGDGMWRQLIDDKEAWPETSGSGMFTYALITGVKRGWLDGKIYGPIARKAWIALTSYIDANGDVKEVCQGTNKENSRDYYLNRKRITGDMHGQAPVLWSAVALIE